MLTTSIRISKERNTSILLQLWHWCFPISSYFLGFLGQSSGGVGAESQRVISWLGRSVSQIAQNAPIQRSYPASTADFFSLPESPMASDGEESETESMEKRARRLYRAGAIPDPGEVR